MKKGVISKGIKCPIFRQGDNLVELIYDSIKADGHIFQDKDIIGITESIVARAQGNYVTLADITGELQTLNIKQNILLYKPIMSRNRFSMILKALALYCYNIVLFNDDKYDCQGNPVCEINQFTGVDMLDYYNTICKNEDCNFEFLDRDFSSFVMAHPEYTVIDCQCHPNKGEFEYNLTDICKDKCEWGLLGSNKADDYRLKLFPNKEHAQELVEQIQRKVKDETGKSIEVMIYGDGCFKDPVGGIWEFADPVTTPAYTTGLIGTPNEIKLKAFADGKYKNLSGQELQAAIDREIESKNSNLVGNMASQGTTPRRYIDLLASLMDLTSGSGDRATPVVIVQNYL